MLPKEEERLNRFIKELGLQIDSSQETVSGKSPAEWVEEARSGQPVAQALCGVMLQSGGLGSSNHPEEGLRWLLSASTAPISDLDAAFSSSTNGSSFPLLAKSPSSSQVTVPKKRSSASIASDGASSNPIPPPKGSLTRRQMGSIARLLGETYRKGIGCAPDLNTAFRHYRRAALLSNVEGYIGLAGMYERGDGIVRDHSAALSLYKKAAESGSVLAMYKVGLAHEKGRGTPVNFALAKHWYQKSTSQGCFPASVRLAILSLDSAYETIDKLTAAAESVSTGSTFHDLAIAYSSTRHGAIPDARLIRKWYRKGAKAGHRRSQWQLGKSYDDIGSSSKEHEKELEKAFFWYHAAAIQGYLPAQWAVSNMYRRGRGVVKNLEMAELWQQAANRSGVERAPPELVEVGVPFLNGFEDILPYWNATDSEKVFNVVSPVNSALEANILGSSVSSSGGVDGGTISRLFNSLPAQVPVSPSKLAVPLEVDAAGFPSTFFASLNQRTIDAAVEPTGDQCLDYSELESECEGYFCMEALLHSMRFSHFAPSNRHLSLSSGQKSTLYVPSLQDQSHTAPRIEQLEPLRPSHQIAVPKLINLKQKLLQAEDYSRKGKHLLAVQILSAALRGKSMLNAAAGNAGGLLDLQGCYNWRLLTAVSVQNVLSTDPENPDALFVDVFINSGMRPAELAIVYLDRAIEARLKWLERRRASLTDAKSSTAILSDAELAHGEEDPVVYLMRAGYKAKLGLWDRAFADYETAVKVNESLPEVDRVPEVYYHRGVCYSNLRGLDSVKRADESVKRGQADVLKYLTLVPDDDKCAADALYTIAGFHLQLQSLRSAVDYYFFGLKAETLRLPFAPPVVNTAIKARLALLVKTSIPKTKAWSSIESEVLRVIDGGEIQSITRTCVACFATGRTKVCGGCRESRYCSTNCQIAHWLRGHAAECRKMGTTTYS